MGSFYIMYIPTPSNLTSIYMLDSQPEILQPPNASLWFGRYCHERHQTVSRPHSVKVDSRSAWPETGPCQRTEVTQRAHTYSRCTWLDPIRPAVFCALVSQAEPTNYLCQQALSVGVTELVPEFVFAARGDPARPPQQCRIEQLRRTHGGYHGRHKVLYQIYRGGKVCTTVIITRLARPPPPAEGAVAQPP